MEPLLAGVDVKHELHQRTLEPRQAATVELTGLCDLLKHRQYLTHGLCCFLPNQNIAIV